MVTMNNETNSKWSPKMLMTCAIFIDLGVLSCLIIMPLFKCIQDIGKLIYLTIISWFHSMTSLFRHWKNRLRCSNKRYIHHSRSSIFPDNEFKTVHITMDKLLNENHILKERFDKLEDRCQRWVADEQIYLLKRIEQLEDENRRLHENYRTYQKQSEKCIESVTDLIIKTLFTQEELKKQCTDLHNVIDTVQLRKKVQQNELIIPNARSISCQFTSNQSNLVQRHTTNDQSTWFHQNLMIVEDNDQKTKTQPSELHIGGSQSSVYSHTMAATKYKSRIPSTGLSNELYFASHKLDGDNEKTPPVLIRNKRRSPHLNIVPVDSTPATPNNRRPISSPVRSTTYVLQQHNRINNNHNNITNKKRSSPVHQHHQSPSITPMTLNKNRQTQQQRTYSNHERLQTQTPSTVDSLATNQQFTSRAHIALTPRRTSPIVKSTPTKTTAYISRSPRIPNTPPIRPSRPTAPTSSITTTTAAAGIQPRSPRIQLRPPSLTPTNQRTISSSPTTNKSIRPHYTLSKSPEQLRAVTGTVIRSRPANTIVNKSKMSTINTTITNNKTIRTPVVLVQPTPSTPRVSDLDALMAEKYINNNTALAKVEFKSPIISPSPIGTNIRRSLFSTDSVKIVRPVRSQELKIFSCHLTTETSTPSPSPVLLTASNEISYQSNIDETLSTLTPTSPEQKTDDKPLENQIIGQNDDSSSNTSAVLRDLSEDSLNSLNEHYHIRQLLKSNASITATNNDSIENGSSNEDIPESSGVTSWSRIRSSCDSNISNIAPLKSETSTSPALYNGPVRQENIQMASDGRYFLLIDDNLSSEESQLSKTTSSSSLSRSVLSLIKTPIIPTDRKPLIHRLVFPPRLGRILFYRRVLSDSDIYQKLCSKDNEINHNVYHLDTIRDYAMEFYMLTTYGSDSQLRAWVDNNYDDIGNNTCYFDDNRFQSFDDDDDDDENPMKIISSSDSINRDEDLNPLHADEELDWYSELEAFNLSSNNQQWKNENVSSCSSEDHVGELLRAEQFSVSSLTTTTSADSSSSTGLISASWPLTNGIHYQVHSNRSSQSLGSPPLSNLDDQSNTILKEILTYPWTNEISDSNINPPETENDQIENGTSSSIVHDEFQPDFYYLSPLKNTTSFLKTDEKPNGIHRQLSHDV